MIWTKEGCCYTTLPLGRNEGPQSLESLFGFKNAAVQRLSHWCGATCSYGNTISSKNQAVNADVRVLHSHGWHFWAVLWFFCRKNDVDYRKYSSKDLWAHAFISTSVTVMLWNVLLKQQGSKCKSICRSEARPAACDHQLPSNRVRASFISDSQLADLCSYLFGSDFCIFHCFHKQLHRKKEFFHFEYLWAATLQTPRQS